MRPLLRWPSVCVLGLIVLLTPAWADDAASRPAGTGPFDAERYLAHIRYLADDARGGRFPGTEGIHQATEYIVEQFKAAGLEPAGEDGTWFQPFEIEGLKQLNETDAKLEVSDVDRAWKLGEDFTPFPFSNMDAVEGPLAFAGYGIDADDEGYNDYANFDATGKVLLILRYEPKAADENATFGGKTPSRHSLFMRKARVAKEHGAIGLLVVNPPNRDPENDELYGWNSMDAGSSYDLPMMHITRKVADAILENAKMPTLAKLVDELDEGRESLSTDLKDVTVRLNPGLSPVHTRNVIGVLKGGDMADEYIVIGAHHDHVGTRPSRGEGGAQVFNGADDNASGTAGVIELARVLSKGPKLRRSVLFMTFSAEELGLRGSAYFADHPTVPMDKIRAMINFDMIGRLKQDKLEIVGEPTAAELPDIVHRAAEALDLHYQPGGPKSEFFDRSDQASFYHKGVPVLFLFTGVHSEYHRPGDDWPLIDAEGATRLLQFADTVVTELANMKDGPTFVEPGEETEEGDTADNAAAAPQPRGMPRVRLGVIPQMDDDKPGMLISQVMDGGAAAGAGMKSGDRIIRIDDHEIKSMSDYLTSVSDYSPGDEATVTVVRDGKEVKLKLTFGGASDEQSSPHGDG